MRLPKAYNIRHQIQTTAFLTNFWEWFLVQPDFSKDIKNRGFHELDRTAIVLAYKKWCDRNGNDRFGRSRNSLSIPSFVADFYSQTPHALRSNGLFLVPTGGGNSIIFHKEVFDASFLNLNGMYSRARRLPLQKKNGFENLIEALSIQWNEQSFIKALHFCGAFRALIRRVCKVDTYMAGPSGTITCRFPFWMKTKRGRLVKFLYEGMTDLDECLYPVRANIVMPIEAKVQDEHNDLSWHKLAFPCYRFIDNSSSMGFRTGSSHSAAPYLDRRKKVKIMPVYCVFNPILKESYIYVFRGISMTHQPSIIPDRLENGIVLNEKAHFEPAIVFKVDMKWIGRTIRTVK
jgi:hypothetical protein